MKTLLLTIPFCLLSASALYAQGLHAQLSGGLMLNNGIRSTETKNLSLLYGNATGEFSVLADYNNWQAGAAIATFNIRNKTQFLFEQDIVPDSLAREYDISTAAPAITPYIYANYKIPVGDSGVYFFAGARLGYFFTAREQEQHYPLYGMLNSQWQVVLHSRPCAIYGLHAGLATTGSKRISAGATVSWQMMNTKATMNYTAVYTLYDMYSVPRRYTMNINKEISYNLQLYSIQVFLRVRLNKTEKPAEEVPKQENE
ncbi:MAG TPA: hypothetical protein VIN07_03035 [Flavipsychrobacter sp.]